MRKALANIFFCYRDINDNIREVDIIDICLAVEVNKFPRLTLSYPFEDNLLGKGTEIFLKFSFDAADPKLQLADLESRWFLLSSGVNLIEKRVKASFSCHPGAFSNVTSFAVNNVDVKTIVENYFDSSYQFNISIGLPLINTFVSYADTLELLFERLAKFTSSFFAFVPKYQDNIVTWEIRWKKSILELKGSQHYNLNNDLVYGGNLNNIAQLMPSLSTEIDMHVFDTSVPLEIVNIIIEPCVANIKYPNNFSGDIFENIDSQFSKNSSAPVYHSGSSEIPYYQMLVDAGGEDLTLDYHGVIAILKDYNCLKELFDFSLVNNFSEKTIKLEDAYFTVGYIFVFSATNAWKLDASHTVSPVGGSGYLSELILQPFSVIQYTLPSSLLNISEHFFRDSMPRFKSVDYYDIYVKNLRILFDNTTQIPLDVRSVKYPICQAVIHKHPSKESMGPIKLDDNGFYKTRIFVKIIGVNNPVEVDWAIPLASFNASHFGGGRGGDFVLVPEMGTIGYVMFLGNDGAPIFFLNSHYPELSTCIEAGKNQILHSLTTFYGISVISEASSISIETPSRLYLRSKRVVDDSG